MKILLVRNDRLGNLICTTPVIEALRRHYPTAQIDIVVN
ncbi:MAG: heptosyltransferase, partial [Epsilonproteobacteria bacterium]|nr:heptosyltransferase [Campylobacterota bacterium]NPA88781.1 glycosyltransferase family 9 protein [Campylobacterota bacterium]